MSCHKDKTATIKAIFINKDQIQEGLCLPLQYPWNHILTSFTKLFTLTEYISML